MIPPAARTVLNRAAVARAPVAVMNVPAPRYYSASIHENDPELLELEKKRNLTKNQHKTSETLPDTAPGWNEYLASAAEAAVKADRSTAPVDEMQKRTVKHLQERHHTHDSPVPHPVEGPDTGILEPGTATSKMRDSSGEDGSPSQEAVYERDEIDGPLRQAKGETREASEEKAKRRLEQ
ncbi:hypothetical protein OBBRIDRAFT_790659 [Obba rivulosa]|uniref:Uncharacterized protein n=1 Tax=Obba rivulosa TaxID=1052685 RepID=A0A8E2AYU8_9APHY|nr:hypothetical protein OBBRIDRAFT_790659 [Obba rivulosa]